MDTEKSKIAYHEPQRIDSLPEEDFDALPFGAIKLDTVGRILKYNLYESRLAERDAREAIGQNFFTDVAPALTSRSSRGVTVKEWPQGY